METPGKKFTDLVEIENPQDTDLTLIRNETGVKKATLQKLSDYIKQKFVGWVFSDLITKDKTIPGAIKELNSALVTVRTVNEWTMIEYPNNLIEAWRYATLSSAGGTKTNTLSLPTPMKDSEYGVKISPVFNGHLCHAIWAGTKTGADGRTKTTVQVSMDSTDSDSNVGVFLFISGYRSA